MIEFVFQAANQKWQMFSKIKKIFLNDTKQTKKTITSDPALLPPSTCHILSILAKHLTSWRCDISAWGIPPSGFPSEEFGYSVTCSEGLGELYHSFTPYQVADLQKELSVTMTDTERTEPAHREVNTGVQHHAGRRINNTVLNDRMCWVLSFFYVPH